MRLRLILGPLLAMSGSAQAEDAYPMLSPLHRGAAQNHVTRGRECEAGVFTLHGNQDYSKGTVDIQAQGGAVGCRQALNEGGLVLGMEYKSTQMAGDGVIFRNEYVTTSMQPSLMYALGPMATVGFAVNFDNTEVKTSDQRFAAFIYTSELSLSLHQEKWELTLVQSDRSRNNEHPDEDVPRRMLIQALANPFPFFGLGLHIERVDYQGVAIEDEPIQNESTFGVLLTSHVFGFTAEAVADLVSAAGGDPDAKGKSVQALLGYRFNQTIKMAASVAQYSSESEAYRLSMTRFGLSVGAMF